MGALVGVPVRGGRHVAGRVSEREAGCGSANVLPGDHALREHGRIGVLLGVCIVRRPAFTSEPLMLSFDVGFWCLVVGLNRSYG